MKLYSSGKYLDNCTIYEFKLEPGEDILVMLNSDSPVSGRFAGWQEIPYEKRALGLSILKVGLSGIGLSITVI